MLALACSLSPATAREGALPDGRPIAPAGFTSPLEGFADAAAISPDREWFAVAAPDTGTVDIVATHAKKAASFVARFSLGAASGILWTTDGLFVSSGYSGIVKHFTVAAPEKRGKSGALTLVAAPDIALGPGLISGLAEDEATRKLYVARTANREVVGVDLTLPLGPATRALLKHYAADGQPYGLAFAHGTLFAALYDSDSVDAWSAPGGAATAIVTGPHPTHLLARGDTVYVSNADGHEVVALDAASLRVAKRYDLGVGAALPGQTPAGMALSDDGATLYVAESGFDDVAVVDVAGARVRGRIPTAAYPTDVAYVAEKPPKLRDALWIVNARGFGAQADPGGEWDGTYNGAVQHVAVDDVQLREWTAQVARIDRFPTATHAVASRAPHSAPNPAPIAHVVFIVRENKHFDEEFGDLPGTDGDPNLVLYGKRYTPNAHALAARYTVFDNFFTDGEASIYGHAWTTQGWANDYHVRNARMADEDIDSDANVPVSIWPQPLHHAGVTTADMDFDWFANLADLPKGPRINPSGVFGPRGELIDELQRRHIGFRVYGEQMTMRRDGTIVPGLADHADRAYPGTHIDFGVRDVDRAKRFLDDVKAHGLAAYSYLTLPTDHTAGTKPGYYTPASFVADNDVALGQIVAGLSKRPEWKSTLVLVTCDDAQGTGDHVDSHRMPALAIGPFVRRGFVDHTHYDQTSILRTVESLFALQPLSIYDDGTPPMFDMLAKQADPAPFVPLPAQIALEKNPGAIDPNNEASFVIDGDDSREIPDQEWASIKGPRSLADHRAYLARLERRPQSYLAVNESPAYFEDSRR
jgi:YVTN family beta-propeller protein